MQPAADPTPAQAAKTRTSSKVWVRWGLLVLFAIGTAISFWPFVAATRAMQQFCETLPLGASVAQVQQIAQAGGYQLDEPLDGRARIHDPANWENMSCPVRFGASGLERAP